MRKIGKYILKGLMALLAALPLKVHYALGRFVAWLAGTVFRYRYNDVTVNLSRSFPELKYKEIAALRKQFYRHFGDIVAEAVWFGGCSEKRLRRQRIVEVVNPETINRLYEESPSVVVMYTHCGNWELLGGIASYNYTDTPTYFEESNFCVVYKKMSSKTWDEIMRDNRFAPLKDRRHFPGYIESNDLARYVFSHREEKKFYNINTDQSPYFNSRANLDIEFMHQPTKTMTAAAALAKKFGMAVAYQRMMPDRKGHYTLEYIPICQDASTMSVEDIMKRYYELLEQDLNAMPANYLWTHRRWKIKMQ